MKSESSVLSQPSEFLVLPANVYLVKGSAGAALYDLRERKVWAVPTFFARALEACGQGLPFDTALKHTLGKNVAPSACETFRRFAREHPALDLAAEVSTRPSSPPLSRNVQPSWLMLEITDTCDLRCCHCYVSARPQDRDAVSLRLPTSRWIKLLVEGREIGFRSLQLTGGEPTLHAHLPLLLRSAHHLGYRPVSLFTNLTCLNDELFSLLRETKAQVHSSLYSHDAAIHDSITGMAGSFDGTVKGLRRLLAAEIETYVNLVLMEKNARGRDKTVAFLGGLGIGPDHIKISCARPQGRGADLPPMTVSPFWPRKFDGWTVENGTNLAANTCWAGRTAIASNGDVFVCVGERKPIGNVVSASFRSIVESAAMRSLWQITLEDVPGCSRCEYRYGCFDCRADAHLLAGDLLGRDPTCPYDPETGQWRYEEIAMSDKPKHKDGFVVEEVENDLVVADFSRSQMHVLNPVAAAIWDMCDGRHTVEEMAELVAAHFTIPLADVCRDVACILGEFGAKGLVE